MLVTVAIGNLAAQGNTGPDEVSAIKAMIAKYAAVVNVEPVDLKLASEVWDNSPDVTFIHPLGEEHGWEAVKHHFYEGIMEAMFRERKLTIGAEKVHVYGDAAWAEFEWEFTAKPRTSGPAVAAKGRETQIYRKLGENRWVLVHVHYSGMPGSPQ